MFWTWMRKFWILVPVCTVMFLLYLFLGIVYGLWSDSKKMEIWQRAEQARLAAIRQREIEEQPELDERIARAKEFNVQQEAIRAIVPKKPAEVIGPDPSE